MKALMGKVSSMGKLKWDDPPTTLRFGKTDKKLGRNLDKHENLVKLLGMKAGYLLSIDDWSRDLFRALSEELSHKFTVLGMGTTHCPGCVSFKRSMMPFLKEELPWAKFTYINLSTSGDLENAAYEEIVSGWWVPVIVLVFRGDRGDEAKQAFRIVKEECKE